MYKKIADYGLIGDMHSIALISDDGSIDYCSMPHIDSPTVFAALLDDGKGGFFRIQPQGRFYSEQNYIKDTNVLSCTFRTEKGQAQLVDFMPVTAQKMFDRDDHSIHRCLKAISGTIDFKLECFPRTHYAAELPRIEKIGNIFKITAKKEKFTLTVKAENYQTIENDNNGIVIHFSLQEQQDAHFDFIYGEKLSDELEICSFEETHRFWKEWVHSCMAQKCYFLGEHTDMINRSLLALKLLTFRPTGAIAAAAITSLPECIGGERNWDYRFTWIRDASFTLKAMFSVGHVHEADCFIRWLHGTYQKYGSHNLQIMYSLMGKNNPDEKALKHLNGYKDSSPVRVGNVAYKQNQWDIYGEIMDTALRLSDYAGKIDETLWPFFRDICSLAKQNWRKPDYGIWEVRNGPFHFVYSKVMCWVALDLGITIALRYGFLAPVEEWEREREIIKQDILKKGYDSDLSTFVQYYGSKDLDASLLLLPLIKFLPIHDERIQNTIEACREKLMRKGFLLRYSGSDGLNGEEGSFILCNFWLIECLALSGKTDEAKRLLAETLKAANPLGLFSEEYDYEDGEMLGNFPQAFSHIGFINAVSAIFHVESKQPQNKMHTSWLHRMEKRVPYKIILNKTNKKFDDVSKEIAAQLKVTLNSLQAAFFDVEEGRVNYHEMKNSQSYSDYLELAEKLNYFDPRTLKTDEEKKAFWINIYNILIIHGVIELDIHNSVKEVFHFFHRIGYIMKGFFFTPNDIEHGILRGNRPPPVSKLRQFLWFDKRKVLCLSRLDPRIHFSLVCAASSCPPIEFYDPAQIHKQFDIAGRSFMNRRGMILNKVNNTLFLSQIFKWYASDFGKTQRQMIQYIMRFANEETKGYIEENISNIKIHYLPYNWNLNKSLE